MMSGLYSNINMHLKEHDIILVIIYMLAQDIANNQAA